MDDAKTADIWSQPKEAENYSKSRPDYPEKVVDIAIKFLRQKYQGQLQRALDIGCGTGKSTEHLINKFSCVIGSDVSQAMLEEARKIYGHHNHVSFVHCCAEDLSQFMPNLFQLILASRCIHYFDTSKFFAEVEKCLNANGVLVYYTLQFEVLHSLDNPGLSHKLTACYDEFLEDWLGDFWSQPKHLPDGFKFRARNRKEYYIEILQAPQFVDRKVETFEIRRQITLNTLRNLLLSYSATLNYKKAHGEEKTLELVEKCIGNIKKVLQIQPSSNESKIEVVNEFFMVMLRKP